VVRGALHPVPQVPPLQSCPLGHATPHAPQWVASIVVSTQAPLHTVWPLGQAQRPAVHRWSSGQTMPQPPQWVGSVVADTQASPQRI